MLALLLALALGQTPPPPGGVQGFSSPVAASIADVTGGAEAHLQAVEADPATPGREILVYLPGAWVFSVGRWHPTKHGVGGAIAGPGLCVEAWTPIRTYGPVWHFFTVGDYVNGDGLDDVLVYRIDGGLDAYAGRGLTACR